MADAAELPEGIWLLADIMGACISSHCLLSFLSTRTMLRHPPTYYDAINAIYKKWFLRPVLFHLRERSKQKMSLGRSSNKQSEHEGKRTLCETTPSNRWSGALRDTCKHENSSSPLLDYQLSLGIIRFAREWGRADYSRSNDFVYLHIEFKPGFRAKLFAAI